MSNEASPAENPILAWGRRAPAAPDLIEAFSERVRERPEAAAAEFSGRALSYAALDAATDALAARLAESGVGPSSRVAVAMPRGFGELCALLATLKAGGAYVPVDPSHPVERVRVILEDAEPTVLLAPADSPLREALPAGTVHVVPEDPEAARPGRAAFASPKPAEGQIAYILFTSGSTGRPKGVEVPRAAFANFLQSMAAEPGLKAGERVLAITTTTFDIAGLELFLPLYSGGTVVIADRDSASDPSKLKTLFEESNLDLMQATPATWRLLLEAGWKGKAGLRMLCGGEAMSLSLAQRLAPMGAQLWNVYGPTETTVWSTLELIPPGVDKITVGHPVDNTLIFLRSKDGRTLPAGEVGEICIGGDGVALGYRGRPDLTEEKFLKDPSSGLRFYRTGDLGRFLPDGRLECLGRVDHQVKIRGFRIEPADIEAQLRAVSGVKEVLVVAVAADEGDPLLVAYFVGKASRQALRERAKDKLPRYMVPSAYVRLESFPLTTSGKIDRKALPAPDLAQESGDETGTAPRDDRESMMAAIWREVLGLSFVPVDEDFFSLGGTSIRAVQLRDDIHRIFGVDLPMGAIFEHPTIEGLIAALGEPQDPDAPIVLKAASGPDGRAPWMGLMGVQLYEDMGREMDGKQGLMAMHVPVRWRPGVDPFPSVPQIAERYASLVRTLQPSGPYWLMGLCHGGVVAFETAAQLEAAGEKVAMVALLDAELPSARRSVPALRLLYALRDVILRPADSWRRFARRLSRAAPAARTDPPEPSAVAPMDMPFSGPEIDADLERYEASGRRIAGRAVAFRATKSDAVAPWMRVEPHMGWTGRVSELILHDIPSTHIGIVRGEHGSRAARLMMEAREALEDAAGAARGGKP